MDELIPTTPGLVAVFETSKGTGAIPVVGFFKAFNGSGNTYTAAVLNEKGSAVPVTQVRGYKRIRWGATVGTVEETFTSTKSSWSGPSLMEAIFGKL